MPSIPELTRGVIHAAVEIAAPPARVFRALVDPAELQTWWGSAETYRTEGWELDLREGGRWSCAAVDGQGARTTVRGEFRVIDPPRVLEMTWEPSWEGFIVTVLRYELEPVEGGTRLTVRHSGFGEREAAVESHSHGWKLVLGWLAAHCTPRRA